MKKKTYLTYLAPLILLLVFLMDGQISTLMTNWSPGVISISSHMVLMLGIFLSFHLPLLFAISLYAVLGLIYDLYYLGVLGIAITLLPLSVYLIYYFYQSLPFRAVTN